MKLAFRSIKVYLRLLLVVTLLVGVALVFYMNRSHEVRFWFFWLRDESQPVNVIWLMLGTAGGSLAGWWTLSLGWRMVRDWRELKRLREIEQRDKLFRGREAELEARERRLKDKEVSAGVASDADDSETTSADPDDDAGEGEVT